jgi:lipopolysaccharide transport system ATP-binding protein
MKPIIEVSNIYKKYRSGERQSYYTLRDAIADIFHRPFGKKADALLDDEFWALRDVSFSIMQGEVIGIIGKNGAGKSTILKILSRITPPSRGEAILRGQVASLLEVGTGFQPELTGRENIYLNGAILGMTRAEVKKKFDEIVAFSELEKFLDMPVKHYSSGMYVRLGFAIAAHLDLEILIIDEVLAVGDLEFQDKCLKKLEEIRISGKTIIFVSHNMESVRRLCKRVLLFDKGRLISQGNAKRIIQQYGGSINKT